jgi:hypothetical protein
MHIAGHCHRRTMRAAKLDKLPLTGKVNGKGGHLQCNVHDMYAFDP